MTGVAFEVKLDENSSGKELKRPPKLQVKMGNKKNYL